MDEELLDKFRKNSRRADTILRQTMALELAEVIAIYRQHEEEVSKKFKLKSTRK